MTKRKLLTAKNKEKLYKALRAYLVEVIQEEEELNTLDKVIEDIKRVKCYKTSPLLTIEKVENYLKGLVISVMYSTYDICKYCFSVLDMNYDIDSNNYIEEDYDIDCLYWNSLAKILFTAYLKGGK